MPWPSWPMPGGLHERRKLSLCASHGFQHTLHQHCIRTLTVCACLHAGCASRTCASGPSCPVATAALSAWGGTATTCAWKAASWAGSPASLCPPPRCCVPACALSTQVAAPCHPLHAADNPERQNTNAMWDVVGRRLFCCVRMLSSHLKGPVCGACFRAHEHSWRCWTATCTVYPTPALSPWRAATCACAVRKHGSGQNSRNNLPRHDTGQQHAAEGVLFRPCRLLKQDSRTVLGFTF